ncbi:hypothetical protein AUC47_15960 [Microbacterium sp. SZ1]|uniref:hypothetical protein n=1 Tax=Microbacterium sp. SZ1 TaxID=1849736 RepID=UPI000BBC0DAF|nr:hypothetical protein [Microbacterium sp. SZ1]PCE14721.1 hypothetical protein AUC47_15960 [Microbacterium sp. SZ1]
MKTKTAAAILTLALMTVSAAGCASDPAPSPTSSTTATDAPSPSRSPTLTPPAADLEDPTTWTVSAEGVGPVKIGGDLASTLSELSDAWQNDPANCSWTAWWQEPGAGYQMYAVRGTESDTAPITEISVNVGGNDPAEPTQSPMTAKGIGLGASKDEVLAAYPGAQEIVAQIGDSTFLMVPGADPAHVFFAFPEGVDAASSVVVTTRSEPSYEVCG